LARTTHVPLGYLDDPDATEATFPLVDGVRVAVPGDRARMEPDGRFVLLGRDSLVVNTGGEKVFVEEVEDALKRCDAVCDAVVVGRPDERFGQAVVAIVQLAPGGTVDPAALRDQCSTQIARYKAPRAFLFVDRIQRHPSGKADYSWARQRADDAVAVV
jgi:fatty-acyl-CoA synthase